MVKICSGMIKLHVQSFCQMLCFLLCLKSAVIVYDEYKIKEAAYRWHELHYKSIVGVEKVCVCSRDVIKYIVTEGQDTEHYHGLSCLRDEMLGESGLIVIHDIQHDDGYAYIYDSVYDLIAGKLSEEQSTPERDLTAQICGQNTDYGSDDIAFVCNCDEQYQRKMHDQRVESLRSGLADRFKEEYLYHSVKYTE